MSMLSSWLGQDAAKLAGEASKRATQQAETQYAETSPYRTIGKQKITTPGGYDFSSDYAGGPSYHAVNDPLYTQATAAQSKSLKDLTNGPDRMAMVTQALADYDAADQPRRAQGIRRIGQDAARLGRVGAEGVGTDIGNFELAAEGERERQKNALLRDATEANVNDRYRTAGVAGDVAQSSYGRGANERQYGDTLSVDEIERRINQRDRERAADSTQFNEGLSLTELGYGFSPENAYRSEAATRQAEADRAAAAAGSVLGAATNLLPTSWFSAKKPAGKAA